MRKAFLSKCIILILVAHLWICASVANTDGTIITNDRPVYTISAGDQLLITVVGHEKELTALVTVRPDGMITYPVVGDMDAAGFTIAQLSSDISERLSDLGYYENAQVTVQLKNSSQETIYVFGDVKEPGQKKFPVPVNVIDVLAAAGGYEETADLASVRIIKKQKNVVSVDLKKLLKDSIIDRGVVSNELLNDEFILEDGDVLIIPSAVKEDRINIIGHVQKPGQYAVKSTVSLISALALAGGTLETSADLKHIKIIKADGSIVIADATHIWNRIDEKCLPSNLSPHQTENITEADPNYQKLIQPGDSVFVPEKGKVSILGSVKNQGQFAVDGEIGVIEALALAGVEENANLKKLRIVRGTGEQITLNASKIWKQPGREFEEKLAPGDTLIIPRTFRINWSAVSTSVLILSTLYAIFR